MAVSTSVYQGSLILKLTKKEILLHVIPSIRVHLLLLMTEMTNFIAAVPVELELELGSQSSFCTFCNKLNMVKTS